MLPVKLGFCSTPLESELGIFSKEPSNPTAPGVCLLTTVLERAEASEILIRPTL